ncbi:hypothetical protein [Hydrogenophaga taeniospiralis]|uniref:hypothetical protein n=1 Tax=Hydrogenophaga taeniospiralis TaxID=65656 RepID=UPI001CFBBBCE|nr:hypothetical protein [Hydrogenophaga taeniospiralis]UCU95229.1 hypothetical protein KI616_05045 [Hydrogenophaga taeniospiralis]
MAIPKPDDLGREKTLLALYLLGRKFPYSKFNRRVTLAVALALTAFCYLQWENTPLLSAALRKYAEISLSFCTSILGFLIAGFTVFVTVTKLDIFTTMAKIEFESTGESYLKYNLVQFMLVFSHYIAFLFVCICFALFFQPQGLVSILVDKALSSSNFSWKADLFYKAPVTFVMIVFGAWSIYLVLLLKSFVYNTFQVITTTVRWELELQEKSSTAIVSELASPRGEINP